jgi:hypothetical protein
MDGSKFVSRSLVLEALHHILCRDGSAIGNAAVGCYIRWDTPVANSKAATNGPGPSCNP